jgi:hypothetical protein
VHGIRLEGLSGVKKFFVRIAEKITCRLSSSILCTSRSVENKLVDFKRFAEIYENVYLNTFYSESNDFNKSEAEIEKQVLEEVLNRFNNK